MGRADNIRENGKVFHVWTHQCALDMRGNTVVGEVCRRQTRPRFLSRRTKRCFCPSCARGHTAEFFLPFEVAQVFEDMDRFTNSSLVEADNSFNPPFSMRAPGWFSCEECNEPQYYTTLDYYQKR